MRAGDILTITPSELVAGGDALARIDGFPVFASNVFPGDVARVRLYEVKKGFAKADLVELVTPSVWRRAMPCPIAEKMTAGNGGTRSGVARRQQPTRQRVRLNS